MQVVPAIAKKTTHPGHREWRQFLKEPGYGLAGSLRRRMESCLGHDFGNVVLHVSRLSDRLCRELGARAFAFGDHIGFAQGAYDPRSERGLRLLAHELAHVVQQRLGHPKETRDQKSCPPRRALELEADAAASAALRGRAYGCTLADSSGVPACWDIAGHYYTPYLMFLNAGVDKDVAERLALWCWLPDQVEEFDAAHVGEHSFVYSSAWHHSRDTYEKYGSSRFFDESQYVKAVQAGFHVLTGGSSADETKERTRIFGEAGSDVKLLCRGISLHAFGDCFAHRDLDDGGLLYGAHAPFGHGFAGHSPDNIFDDRRAYVYIAYVRALHELATKYSGKAGIVDIDDMVAALSAMLHGMPLRPDGHKALGRKWSEVAPKVLSLAEHDVARTEEGCCAHIRAVARELVGIQMSGRNPTEESVPWKDYYARLKTWIIQDSGGKDDSELIFYTILNYAVKWSKISLPAKGSHIPRRRRIS